MKDGDTMANIKISELTSETDLSENHIVITEQENATETKKSTLGLILSWIVGKLPIASNTVLGTIKVDGSTITVDESGTAFSHNGIKVSPTLTLTADGWVDNVQTVEIALDTNNRIVVDETFGEQPTWRECGVYPSSISETGITFTCTTTPTSDLTFKVTSFTV